MRVHMQRTGQLSPIAPLRNMCAPGLYVQYPSSNTMCKTGNEVVKVPGQSPPRLLLVSPPPRLRTNCTISSSNSIEGAGASAFFTNNPQHVKKDASSTSNSTDNVPQGASQTSPEPGSFFARLWLRGLSVLVWLAGRVLSTLAMAFCLLALLLMRPRAVGANDAVIAQSNTATVAPARHSGDKADRSTTEQPAQGHSSRSWRPPFASMSIAMASSSLAQPKMHTREQQNAPAAEAASSASSKHMNGHVDGAAGSQHAHQNSSTASSSVQTDASIASTSGVSTQDASMSEPSVNGAAIFKAAQAWVVNISGIRAAGTFSSLDVSRSVPGLSSGFLWDERGHVIAPYSAVRGAAEVKVTLCDASTFTAKLIGWDAGKDLAVLRLSLPKARLKDLQPAKLSHVSGPGGVAVGAPVWAVANTTGLDHTLTQGVVSGLGRELPGAGPYPLKGLIQIDAACGHQAGGVVLNAQGRVVGMCVSPWQAGGRSTGYGLGFAVPIDAVQGLVAQILATGRPTRPTLGITLAPPQVLAAQSVEGVLVLEVPPGSPAAAAGLRHTHRDIFGDVILGDVIVGLEAMPVRHAGELYAALDARKAGDRVRLDILRDGKPTSLTLVLGERGMAGALEE